MDPQTIEKSGRFTTALRILALVVVLGVLAGHLWDLFRVEYVSYDLSQLRNDREVMYQRYEAYRLFLAGFLVDVVLLWALVHSWPRSGRRGAPPLWRTLLGTFLAVALVFATLEVTARRYHSLPMGPEGRYMADPVLGWRMRPVDGVNADGLRNPPVPVRPAPGEFRVLCLGDSCTYGVFLPGEAAYPMQLQERLRELLPGRTVTVLNAGIPGYNSVQGLTLLRYHLRFRPNLVIWSFASNDTMGMPYQPPQDLSSPLFNALRDSHFYGFLRIEVLHRVAPPGGPAPAQPITQRSAADFLEQARADSARAGATLCLLLFPDADLDALVPVPPPTMPRRSEELAFKPQWRKDYAEAARRLGVPILDPLPVFQEAPRILDLFLEDHYHVNERGGEVLADEIARQLGEKGLLPR